MENVHKEKAGKLLRQGLIGYIIGLAVTSVLMIETGEIFAWLFMGLAFMGIPYGWEITGGVFGTIVGSFPVMVIAFMVRLTAAYMIGLFVYPLVLIYNLIRGYICR